MWINYNPNPNESKTIDCTVRALSLALGTDWDTAALMLDAVAFAQKTMPSANKAWGELLRRNGYTKYELDNECPGCYTAEDFCMEHPFGVYVLGFDTHVAIAIDGMLYDAWDSMAEIPKFIWTKERTL